MTKNVITSAEEKLAVLNLDNAQQIPLAWIAPNPTQPRKDLALEEIAELVASVQELGILEPLLVTRKATKRFILIAGHRRLEAAKLAGLSHVPCIVKEMAESECLLCALTENLQRTDLSPFEEAYAIKQLITAFNLSIREAAAKISKSPSYVGERIALLELPDDIKQAVIESKMPLKKALALAKIPLARLREKLLKKGAGLDTEAFIELINEALNKPKAKQNTPADWKMNLELKEFAKGSNQIRIFKDRISLKYESDDDLRSLLQQILTLLNDKEQNEMPHEI